MLKFFSPHIKKRLRKNENHTLKNVDGWFKKDHLSIKFNANTFYFAVGFLSRCHFFRERELGLSFLTVGGIMGGKKRNNLTHEF